MANKNPKADQDEWGYDIPEVLGVGSVNNITEYKKKIRVRKGRPIGFDLNPQPKGKK